MSKRAPRKSTAPTTQGKPAASEAPAASRGGGSAQGRSAPFWLRLVVAVALVAGSVALVQRAFRETEAELLLGRADLEARMAARSSLREVDIRRAMRLDPDNAQAAYTLANFMVMREMDRLSRGQFNVVDASRFEEAKEILAASLDVVDSQAGVHRRIGEISKAEAFLHERRHERAEAQAAYETAFESYAESARLLPRPRLDIGLYFGDLVNFARRSNRPEYAAYYTREIDHLGYRYYFNERNYTADAKHAFFTLGMKASAMRELRYQLRQRPGDAELLRELEMLATDGGLEWAAILLLEDLGREERLSPWGAEILERLRERTMIELPEEGL